MAKKINPAVKIFNQLLRNEALLEDRREYQAEDLMLMYSLTEADAAELYRLIQIEFTPLPIAACPADTIKQYFLETIHNSFDGWSAEEAHVIKTLILDIKVFCDNV